MNQEVRLIKAFLVFNTRPSQYPANIVSILSHNLLAISYFCFCVLQEFGEDMTAAMSFTAAKASSIFKSLRITSKKQDPVSTEQPDSGIEYRLSLLGGQTIGYIDMLECIIYRYKYSIAHDLSHVYKKWCMAHCMLLYYRWPETSFFLHGLSKICEPLYVLSS